MRELLVLSGVAGVVRLPDNGGDRIVVKNDLEMVNNEEQGELALILLGDRPAQSVDGLPELGPLGIDGNQEVRDGAGIAVEWTEGRRLAGHVGTGLLEPPAQ